MAALLYAQPGHPSVAANECKHVYRIVPNFQGVEFLRFSRIWKNLKSSKLLRLENLPLYCIGVYMNCTQCSSMSAALVPRVRITKLHFYCKHCTLYRLGLGLR